LLEEFKSHLARTQADLAYRSESGTLSDIRRNAEEFKRAIEDHRLQARYENLVDEMVRCSENIEVWTTKIRAAAQETKNEAQAQML